MPDSHPDREEPQPTTMLRTLWSGGKLKCGADATTRAAAPMMFIRLLITAADGEAGSKRPPVSIGLAVNTIHAASGPQHSFQMRTVRWVNVSA